MKRPNPPRVFAFFKWKTRKNKKWDVIENLCPECGETGSCWNGGGWTDPGAQKAYDEGEIKGIILQGGGDTAISYEGVAILCHWSRYGAGYCLKCNVEFWHDFVGNSWQYYYKPETGQMPLF